MAKRTGPQAPILLLLLAVSPQSLIAATAAQRPDRALSGALRPLGLAWPPYASAAVDSVRSLEASGRDAPAIWQIAASSDAVKIRLRIEKGVEAAEAARRTTAEITRINMLYEGPAAYPGMITEKNAVPQSLRPRKIPSPAGTGPTWLIPATARLGYGAANEVDIAYKSLLSFRYCSASRAWARLEIFWPKREFNKTDFLKDLLRFHCLSPSLYTNHETGPQLQEK